MNVIKNFFNKITDKFKSITKEQVFKLILDNKAVFIFLFLLILVSILRGNLFFTKFNVNSLLRSVAVILLIGLGNTIVLATGSVDLSAGNMLSLLGVIYATLLQSMPLVPAILIVMVAGAVFGLLNGSLSQALGLPPFITTLAMGQIYLGASYLISGGLNIFNIPAAAKFIGQGSLFSFLPFSFVIVLLVFIILFVVIKRTKYGRHIIATGGNAKAATLTGINTKKIKISAYVILGVTVSLAAFVLTGRSGVATPAAGSGLEMDAISAVVVGGTSMGGGTANVLGTIFGAFIIGVITNLLNLMSVSSFYQYIAKGLIIIFAIGLDVLTAKLIDRMKISESVRKSKFSKSRNKQNNKENDDEEIESLPDETIEVDQTKSIENKLIEDEETELKPDDKIEKD